MDLQGISFGDRVAENEADKLATYFVKTEQWESLKNGEVDVVFGPKGSGKSALYTLLLNQDNLFTDKNIILISAEKPTGKTVFSDITSEPPTSENEFITLWKIYVCQLIVNKLLENDLCNDEAEFVMNKLREAGLIDDQNTLQKLVNKALRFAKRLIDVESVEGRVTPDGITGKITFRTPSDELEKKGYASVDELIEKLNVYLKKIQINIWVLFDRLDVAFDESLDLEKNALRALFKVYRDIEEYTNIRLKIFLRDDIWKRITNEGFREASHITRSTTISWSDRNLKNLIISRSLDNNKLLERYNVDKDEILSDYTRQEEFYYQLFPKQVEAGERQSDTFNWIKSRVKDGLSNIAPRELIHFYNEAIANERKEQNIGNHNIESPNLISRQAIKNATNEVSKVRTEQTIFAEHPDLKIYVMALENSKAEHNLKTLSRLWSVDEKRCEEIASYLSEIGFFELKPAKTEKLYKIPFLYRYYLQISQGKAY
ncbi:P-loop ATPase, Sll1717 family [Methylomonas sp. MgM2]